MIFAHLVILSILVNVHPVQPNNQQVTILMANTENGKQYTVQSSTNLVCWKDEITFTAVGSNNGVVLTKTNTLEKVFFRTKE